MNFKVALTQYATLLKTLLMNTFRSMVNRDKKVEKVRGIKKLGTVGVVLLALFGIISVLAYLIMMGIELTVAAINSGVVEELQYGFIALAQLSVMFFGIASLMSNLYFSKDNSLLNSLPFENAVAFGAKFSLTYLGELLFSAVIYLPLATTSGVVLISNGYDVNWTFFLVEIVNFLLIPALPLLIASVITQPVMLIVSSLKKKTLGSSIVSALGYLAFFAIYFPVVLGTSSIGESGVMDNNAVAIFVNLKKVTIFNYPLVKAMFGENSAVNIIIYLAGVCIALAIAIIISVYFYKKAITRGAEGEYKTAKTTKTSNNESKSIIKSYLFKDWKTLLHTPQLFVSAVLMSLMPIVVVFFMNTAFSSDMSLEEEMNPQFFMVALATYMVSLMMAVGNPFSFIGFSLEGKNLYMIKSLPISIKDIVKAKFIFASAVTIVATIVLTIGYPLASGIKNAVAIIGLPLQALISGLSFSAIGLYSDLRKPNLSWTSVNEITRNNMKVAKPMFLYVGLSFVYMIIGIMLAVFGDVFKLEETLTFAIYHIICIIPPSVVLAVYVRRLFNAEELFRRIGG